jgi:NodT family efflux transporter outer membrane factor (OMF) lipoprotein
VISRSPRRAAFTVCLLLSGTACAVGPRYHQPDTPVPPAFKEAGNWTPVQPGDRAPRGQWWQVFQDVQLSTLEDQIAVSNQTLKAAAARFAEARALLGSARAGQVPQVTAVPSVTVTDQSANRPLHNAAVATRFNDYLLPVDVSYEADIWGRVRNTVEAGRTAMQASAADLESVSLSLHAELAVDYFTLRGLDAEAQLLDSTVQAYQRALDLTQNRFRGGIASGADVAQAETQLETTRAQAIDISAARAQVEHAIAVIVGQPASTFSLPVATLVAPPPPVPPGLPSDLLERRPDISAAERRVAAANAQVGIRASAFYPLLTLSTGSGFESARILDWLRAASGFWTLAPAAAITVFDGGRRRALSAQAGAAYEQTVADYRESVLVAFREVEDSMATLRVLEEEARTQQAAVDAAERSLELSTNRYRGGVVTYLEVIAAQSAALTNQRASVSLRMRQLTTSVLLIKALGGGWSTASLP